MSKYKTDNLDNIIFNYNIKNYLLDDPIIDWLDNNYNPLYKNDSNQFLEFIKNKEIEFEEYVINQLTSMVSHVKLDNSQDIITKYNTTINYMKKGEIIIVNPCLINKQLNICGNPKLIIRNDYLNTIFNTNYIDNYNNWFYIVLDIKYCKLSLNDLNYPKSNNKIIQNKGQMYFNNLCLSSNQNFTLNKAFLIYRDVIINNSIKKNLAIINFENDYKVISKVMNGIKWYENVNKYGKNWNLDYLKSLGISPNLSNKIDNGWNSIKKEIACQNNDITLLWKCGIKERNYAYNLGIRSWKDITKPSQQLNISENTGKILDLIITINKGTEISFYPRRIKKWNNIDILNTGNVYFICDFETINDMNNDFSSESNGNLIFMVGCICIIEFNGERMCEYKCFKTIDINTDNEKIIINEWLNYMSNICNNYNIINPKIYHWSHAEPIFFNSFCQKNNLEISLNFTDLLKVFLSEPIVVKGAFSYGLKEISKALFNNNLINTLWEEDMNGADAMSLAWSLKENPILMDKIEKYNYIDCKVIDDILNLLQKLINIAP